MDADSLHVSLDHVAGNGLLLSTEQKAALQTSLLIMEKNYKFRRVFFWGKILGREADYFIAQGIVGQDEMGEKQTLYSMNCMEWHLLSPATDAMIAQTSLVKGRFTGDPSFESEYSENKKPAEGEEPTEEENIIRVKEEDRLTVAIAMIDKEVAIVPRGAYIKIPQGEIHRNRHFEGLGVDEAGKLGSYFHFAEPVRLKMQTLLQKADLDPSIDFLDSLESDIPKGSWSLQYERGSSLVVLRSLLWLGLTFYHIPMTPQHGYIYMGTGEKNIDLPFML
ncbi:radial spoke head protein 9 homolog [Latimeria chalumnae]|uniref:Radial spoke head protein 9 homolog n=1 Tax=Latimeria chalumnae TaxID=7897 RepID=H3ATI2_LATCH|nr:PREDICTED: radial spoke head protein 9 homolog [Latimeria chalumnae]|eukprot:XP_005999412.1 PREDICTED: radial spoke head protein 9 homolog [Latimeria chalumnae]